MTNQPKCFTSSKERVVLRLKQLDRMIEETEAEVQEKLSLSNKLSSDKEDLMALLQKFEKEEK